MKVFVSNTCWIIHVFIGYLLHIMFVFPAPFPKHCVPACSLGQGNLVGIFLYPPALF